MSAIDIRTVVDEFSLVLLIVTANLPVRRCVKKCHHILLIHFFVPDYLDYLRSQPFNIIDTMVKIEAVKA